MKRDFQPRCGLFGLNSSTIVCSMDSQKNTCGQNECFDKRTTKYVSLGLFHHFGTAYSQQLPTRTLLRNRYCSWVVHCSVAPTGISSCVPSSKAIIKPEVLPPDFLSVMPFGFFLVVASLSRRLKA
jgi:hypothetical protein